MEVSSRFFVPRRISPRKVDGVTYAASGKHVSSGIVDAGTIGADGRDVPTSYRTFSLVRKDTGVLGGQ